MMANHKIISRGEWIQARKRLLLKEKQFTRLRDQLSQERRALLWEAVNQQYVFKGPSGKETLPELFGRKGQLIV